MTSDPGHGKSDVGEGKEASRDAGANLLSDREEVADARDAALSARSEVLAQAEHDQRRSAEEIDRVLRAADERDHAAEDRAAAARARETAVQARRQRATGDTVLDQAAEDMAAVDQEWAARDRDEAAADREELRRLSTAGHEVRRPEMTPEDALVGLHHSVGLGVPAWVQDSALLDAIGAAVVATDAAGTIFYFNAAAEQLYGYSREEMLGANIMRLLVEPVDEVPAAVIMETVLAGERWSGQFRVRRHGGSNVVVRVTDTPITEQGRVVGVIGVAEPVRDERVDGSIPVTAHIESAALRLAEQMRHAMETRAVIEQAKGMLIAAHGCTADEAFQMLSEFSQRSNRKLRDVAKAMVDGAQSG
jgi:PAS domain S-box-containing protein